MSIGKMWSRFGRIRKLRIHDMSKDLSEAVIDLFLRYFDTEEPLHRAASSHVDTARYPETFKLYEDYRKSLSDPNFSCVICSPDDSDEATDIMGVTTMLLTRKPNLSEIEKVRDKPKITEVKEICAMCKELFMNYLYIPMKHYYYLNSFLDDSGSIAPEIKGLSIVSKLVNKRRLLCKAQGVPMTGGGIVTTK